MTMQDTIKKGDRVQLRFAPKPKGIVVGTVWGPEVNRLGKKVGKVLWIRVRWDSCGYGELDPYDSVIEKDVRVLAATGGRR